MGLKRGRRMTEKCKALAGEPDVQERSAVKIVLSVLNEPLLPEKLDRVNDGLDALK
ncbi:MAG: hypothetical protein JWP47_1863 [Polaromonas sp.]|nr:hypothetical protein [Polaromonas sp.]